MTIKEQIEVGESNKINVGSIPEISVSIISSISLRWSKILLICAGEDVKSNESLILLLLHLNVERFLFRKIIHIIIILTWSDRRISDDIESGDD